VSRVLARRGVLTITEASGGGVQISRADSRNDICYASADDLRWLITTGGPAALHTIGAAPQIRKGGSDAEGPEGS
jgi:hypothetical protein